MPLFEIKGPQGRHNLGDAFCGGAGRKIIIIRGLYG